MSSAKLQFDGQVALLVHGGNKLGRALGSLLASRGAFVVIQDEDGQAADGVVELIKKNGGTAIADHTSTSEGDKLVGNVIQAFGAIHIVVNGMSALPHVHKSFGDMADQEWDAITKERTFGAYKTLRAAWPHLKKQKLGRIVNVVSTTALLGTPGNAAHAAVEIGMIGFTKTLAKEGVKNNIHASTIISNTSSGNQDLNVVIALITLLAHPETKTTNAIFEANATGIDRLQWERSAPHGLKTDGTLSASAVVRKWHSIGDFSASDSNPDGPWDSMALLEQSKHLPPSSQGELVDFKGKVAVVTGAGNGLGRQYALQLARLGARVVVNDLANPQSTVDEITAFGGTAVADQHSVEDGDKVIDTALRSFGGIHILINNAGILRDKSFQAMTDDFWNIIQSVHLRGSYKTLRAAWPHFVKQKYGRVINTTSVSGIYGNFGQSNYAAAKCGTIGLSSALSREGQKHNIRVNTIGPSAGTQLTRTVMPEEVVQALRPDYVAPYVLALLSDPLPGPCQNGLYEIGSGFIAVDRLRRSAEETFAKPQALTPEILASTWSKLGTSEVSIKRKPSNRTWLPMPMAEGIKNTRGNARL